MYWRMFKDQAEIDAYVKKYGITQVALVTMPMTDVLAEGFQNLVCCITEM